MVEVQNHNGIGNPYHDAKGLFASAPSDDATAPPMTDKEFQDLDPDWDKIKDKRRKKFMHDATEYWLGPGYEDVNLQLRDNPDGWYLSSEQSNIRGLDRAFENLGKNIPRDLTLYRGVSADTLAIDKVFKEGAVFRDEGFSATSPDKREAENFTGDKGALLHIKVPKGTRVYKPMLSSKMADDPEILSVEDEVLLRRGSSFKVTKRVGKDVYVELVN